jgi:HAE1 family hydrophobic/amphiphilic exporter-1
MSSVDPEQSDPVGPPPSATEADESGSDVPMMVTELVPADSETKSERRLRGTWPAFAVDRPVATLMLVVAVVVFGWVSLQQLPVNLMPELNYPTLTVRTEYEGAAPEEVEDEISDPIEELVGTVEGVVSVTSVSRAGSSDVQLQFQWDTDLDLASQKVRERVALIDFPDAADPPLILRFDPTLDPILRLAVSGDIPLRQLRQYAEEELQPSLEKIDGVALVRVLGGEEEVIRVAIDEGRLQTFGLDITAVGDRLSAENVNVAGGVLYDGEIEYLVRTLNEFVSLDEMRDLVLAVRNGAPIRLRDIGTVERTIQERTVVTRANGSESIELAIFKEADANLVEVAEAVKVALYGPTMVPESGATEGSDAADGQGGGDATSVTSGSGAADGSVSAQEGSGATDGSNASGGGDHGGGSSGGPGGPGRTPPIASVAPDGVQILTLTDQSTYIRAAIAEVGSTAFTGALWAIVVLLLFLRNGYATVIIALAIPLSVIATFAPLRMMGVSLNIMSLGGLALGIGMLVDNAIVVLESIFRCREEGDDPRRAAIRGTAEVGAAVVASTMTTVAVFAPIAFIDGVAGQMFGDLALTVVLSLLASLLQALFVVPMMSVLPMRVMSAGAVSGNLRARLVEPFGSVATARTDAAGLQAWWGRATVVSKLLLGPIWLFLWPLLVLRGVVAATLETSSRLVWAILLLLAVTAHYAGKATGFLLRWTLGLVLDAFAWMFGGFERLYRVMLAVSVRNGWGILLLCAGLIWMTVQMVPRLGTQLIPELHQGEFTAILRLPVGTRLEQTVAVVEALEDELTANPAIARVASFIGRDEDSLETSDQGEHYAELTIQVPPSDDLEVAEELAMEAVREATANVPALSSELIRPTLFSVSAPVTIEIRGYRLPALKAAADRIVERLQGVAGVQDVRSSIGRGFPEVRIAFDRERLAMYGLEVRAVAEAVRRKVQGQAVTTVREDARTIDVEVALRANDVSTVEQLRSLQVGQVTAAIDTADATAAAIAGANGTTTTPSAGIVTLGAVADITIAEGPSEIRHLDGQRAAVIQAGTSLLDLGAVTESLLLIIDDVPLENGQSVMLAGQADEMDSARNNLLFALALAIFLVYVVMASTFESLIGPLVILVTIPLALIGVVGILSTTQTPISVVAVIGVIILAGIVVNNAIVLVDSILQHRREGLDIERAIVEACTIRLRPVLITTLTTVLGLLPMAFETGEGGEIRQPLALVIMAGLTSSTLLTLFVIPVVYRYVGEIAGPPAPLRLEES